jgi:hypothetical protein
MVFTIDFTCDVRVWRKFIWLRIRHLVGCMYIKDEDGLGLALLFV